MSIVSDWLGSTTSIFWKRRDSARSFSNMPRYSWYVVDPIHFRSPDANTGLIKFEASMTLPEVAPAPIMVCISSINRMECGISIKDFITAFRRFSKSPRYFVPAMSAPISSEYTVAGFRISGTSPSTIIFARPSASAVLPTPASPTSNGLFLRRRQRICAIRSISC